MKTKNHTATTARPAVACGVDWASDHHDVALVDADGAMVDKARIGNDPAGLAKLLELLAENGDSAEAPVPVAIETPDGLLVAALRATGRPVYAINPLAAARYRDRHWVAKAKSDTQDAVTLANILRVDAAAHRVLPDDTDQAKAITVLARAQQDAVWDRVQAANKLAAHLRLYFPAFLAAFHGKEGRICRPDARVLLAAAPTPADAAALDAEEIIGLLRAAGRTRYLRHDAALLREVFTAEQLRHPELVEQAMGCKTLALLGHLDAVCRGGEDLESALAEAFAAHPDAAIILSFPGLGPLTGARILGEMGDDRARFADARGLKAYAGAAPVTRASGKVRNVKTRWIKNNRLASAGYSWAFASLTASVGARAHYDRRREAGDWHIAAQRNLFNRLLGCLHHCLANHVRYDEAVAFPAQRPTPDPVTAS